MYSAVGRKRLCWWIHEWQRLKAEVDDYYQALKKLIGDYGCLEDLERTPAYILLDSKMQEVKEQLATLENTVVCPEKIDS